MGQTYPGEHVPPQRSEHKGQRDRELQGGEERYRTVFESVNDAILILSDSGVVDCNGKAARIFGYASAEEMVGLRPWDISPEVQPDGRDSKAQSRLYDGKALEGRRQNFFWQCRKKDGELFDAEVSLNSFRGQRERYLVAVIRDITESRRAENILRSAVQGTAAATGGRFFRSLVRHLAGSLGVRCGIIGRLEGSSHPIVRTIALWDAGQHRDNITYDLTGTPCEEVLRGDGTVCFSDVQSQFPKGHVLVELGIHTYVGTPLKGSGGEALGVLAIMHDRVLSDTITPHAISVLSLFGVRAATELERMQVENELKAAREHLEKESEALSEKNIALRQILEHLEKDRTSFREDLTGRIETLFIPVVEKLRKREGRLSKKDLDHLEETLKSILGREIDVFRRNLASLTSRELEISEMIRDGLSSNEIADTLTISQETVHKHRESIRGKLKIKHSHLTLASYLRSKPWPK